MKRGNAKRDMSRLAEAKRKRNQRRNQRAKGLKVWQVMVSKRIPRRVLIELAARLRSSKFR
jgi:hypothetical protein